MRETGIIPDIVGEDQEEEEEDDEDEEINRASDDEVDQASDEEAEGGQATDSGDRITKSPEVVTTVGNTVVCGADVIYNADDDENENEPPDDSDEVGLLTNLDFENSPWEVEYTDAVKKWFKQHQKKQQRLVDRVIAKLRQLADGRWDYCQRKPLRGVYADMDLYEAKLNKGARIMWELGIAFSERRSGSGAIYTETIRVWAIVLDHDKLNSEIGKICEAHRRGRGSHLQRNLLGLDAKDRDRTSQKSSLKQGTIHTPRTYSPSDVVVSKRQNNDAKPPTSHYPPASWKSNQYTLVKFYEMSSTVANLLTSSADRASLEEINSSVEIPFKLTGEEFEVINATGPNGQRCSTLLIGRSGTGKTTCCVYKMVREFVTYWRNGLREPDIPNACSDSGITGSCSYHNLRQIFITKSSMLRCEVENFFDAVVTSKLLPTSGAASILRERPRDPNIRKKLHSGAEGLNDLTNVARSRYPLFLTAKDIWRLVDSTLEGDSFLANRKASVEETGTLASLTSWADDEGAENLGDFFQDDSRFASEDVGNAALSARERLTSADSNAGETSMSNRREMTYDVFENLWNKCINSKTNSDLHRSVVWTEIKSYIKGSLEAMRSDQGFLPLDAYLELGKKRTSLNEKQRRQVYECFHNYARACRQGGYWDAGDLIFDLFQRHRKYGTKIVIDRIYADEIQDFTQAEIALILKLVQSPQELFLCGDSAQTIARGVGFRFTDISTLWTDLFPVPDGWTGGRKTKKEIDHAWRQKIQPQRLKLLQNYRSHKGALNLAADVIEIVYELFPTTIDRLPPDTGVMDGPKPILLETRREQDLLVMLIGNVRSTALIEFGAHQAVIVRDDEARRNLPPELKLALVITVNEAKGLEFDDVLLYNFFADSPAVKEWEVLRSFEEVPSSQREWDSTTSFSRVDENEDESLDELLRRQRENSSPASKRCGRNVQFDREKHKLLESELKFLYTAITRSRVNVWIYDSSDQREPFFSLCQKRNLVRVVESLGDDSGTSTNLFAKSTTKKTWLTRGRDFEKRSREEMDDPPSRKGWCFIHAHLSLRLCQVYFVLQQTAFGVVVCNFVSRNRV